MEELLNPKLDALRKQKPWQNFEKYIEDTYPADASIAEDVRDLQRMLARLSEKTKFPYFESMKHDVCVWERMLCDRLKARWGFAVDDPFRPILLNRLAG